MIAVHSPEYDFEKDRVRVERYARKFEQTHPIYLDNDLAFFKAIGAVYWPEFYLVDRRGLVRAKLSGLMEEGTPLSGAAHALIAALLAEKAGN